MNCLALSSPDLPFSPFIDALAANFARAYYPALSLAGDNVSDPVGSSIAELHTKILSDAQKSWYQKLPEQFDLGGNADCQAQIGLIKEQLEADSPWLIHDPLLCNFLPVWNSCITAPVILMHYSEPLECAISLQQKWRFPLSFGLALWESYMLAASRSLAGKQCILVSSRKLRNSGRTHLNSIYAKLEKALGREILGKATMKNDLSLLVPALGKLHKEQLEYVQKSQIFIFDVLEKGKLSVLRDTQLSSQSADILDCYGQLRSGFEMVKAERDQLKQQPITEDQTSVTTGDLSESAVISGSTDEHQQNLCVVKVFLRGMPELEFVTAPDSPVLDMLRQYLLGNKGDQDEMIFLNSVGAENDAIYFMSSSLLAIETEPNELFQ